MTAPFVSALALAFVAAACDRGVRARDLRLTGGETRADLRVESPEPVDGKIPLVIVLHGYRASATLERLYLQYSSLVPKLKFHLVYLEGVRDGRGNRYWNAGPPCCDLDHADADDVGYLKRVIGELRETLPVSKVYLVGHSNGGFMAYRMFCEKDSDVAGILSIAGMDPDLPCPRTRFSEATLIHVYGTADDVIRPEGGSFRGLPQHLSVAETLARWSGRLGCGTAVRSEAPRNYSLAIWGDDSDRREWECRDGNRMTRIQIRTGRHVPWINDRFRTETLETLLGR